MWVKLLYGVVFSAADIIDIYLTSKIKLHLNTECAAATHISQVIAELLSIKEHLSSQPWIFTIGTVNIQIDLFLININFILRINLEITLFLYIKLKYNELLGVYYTNCCRCMHTHSMSMYPQNVGLTRPWDILLWFNWKFGRLWKSWGGQNDQKTWTSILCNFLILYYMVIESLSVFVIRANSWFCGNKYLFISRKERNRPDCKPK